MNTQASRQKRAARVAKLALPVAIPRPPAATPLTTISAAQMPDPWLLDSEAVLNELARVRQLTLLIPARLDNTGAINTVVNAVWDLEQRLRYCLLLRHDAQHAFRRRGAAQNAKLQEHAEQRQTESRAVIALHGG